MNEWLCCHVICLQSNSASLILYHLLTMMTALKGYRKDREVVLTRTLCSVTKSYIFLPILLDLSLTLSLSLSLSVALLLSLSVTVILYFH